MSIAKICTLAGPVRREEIGVYLRGHASRCGERERERDTERESGNSGAQ